jgi:apolipoprotein N-acyltransferase
MRGKAQILALATLSSLLLSAAWYANLSILAFFGFVPLLLAEDKILREYPEKGRFLLFAASYITFLLWNVLVTWWVVYASFGGAMMAFVFNALFMAMIFVIYSAIKKLINRPWAAWLLIPLWIAWEYAHTLWDISWIWLNLGNIFAFNPNWVQWYEFVGASGGSFWILAVNILVFLTIKNNPRLRFFSVPVLRIAVSIIFPILISYMVLTIRMNDRSSATPVSIVAVQPNIDPYGEKFTVDYQIQFLRTLELIRGKVNDQTDYLVLPETFITDDVDERFMDESQAVRWFRDSLLKKFPDLKIVSGGNTYVEYDKENATATSRISHNGEHYYDFFNTALYISKDTTAVYHKSKLVPGVERMPFPALFRPLEKFAINLGGTVGSLGTQTNRAVFKDRSGITVAPVICYESIYADYTTEYMRAGANLIFIITNDGWWDDTPGYRQHLHIGKLRAIENRRQIARSANTGISCFIDEFGVISQATGWWEEAVIAADLIPNDELTFFTRFGDLLSYSCVALSLMIIGFAVYLRFSGTEIKKQNNGIKV